MYENVFETVYSLVIRLMESSISLFCVLASKFLTMAALTVLMVSSLVKSEISLAAFSLDAVIRSSASFSLIFISSSSLARFSFLRYSISFCDLFNILIGVKKFFFIIGQQFLRFVAEFGRVVDAFGYVVNAFVQH